MTLTQYLLNETASGIVWCVFSFSLSLSPIAHLFRTFKMFVPMRHNLKHAGVPMEIKAS